MPFQHGNGSESLRSQLRCPKSGTSTAPEVFYPEVLRVRRRSCLGPTNFGGCHNSGSTCRLASLRAVGSTPHTHTDGAHAAPILQHGAPRTAPLSDPHVGAAGSDLCRRDGSSAAPAVPLSLCCCVALLWVAYIPPPPRSASLLRHSSAGMQRAGMQRMHPPSTASLSPAHQQGEKPLLLPLTASTQDEFLGGGEHALLLRDP